MNKTQTGRGTRLWQVMGSAMLVAALSACASSPPPLPTTEAIPSAQPAEGMLASLADKALEAVGLKKPAVPEMPELPDVPDSALPDRKVNWRVSASDSLNADDEGHGLALVLRLYKLRSPDAFLQASYDTFGDPAKEKAALNDDLIGAREVLLVPGQHYEALEKLAREARFIGVVALYRQPAEGRWRYAFNAASAARTGLTIGALACALTVQVGEPLGVSARAARSAALSCSDTS